MKKYNTKLAIPDGRGGCRLRIFHRKESGKRSPRYLVKCGCCDESVEIYYDEDGLEINGVLASREEWLKLFGALLKINARE